MSEMIERVARAVALQDCCDPDFVDTKGRVQWTYHVELARAAIEAMREPSPEMIEAAEIGRDCRGDIHEELASAYRCMIVAALTPTT